MIRKSWTVIAAWLSSKMLGGIPKIKDDSKSRRVDKRDAIMLNGGKRVKET